MLAYFALPIDRVSFGNDDQEKYYFCSPGNFGNYQLQFTNVLELNHAKFSTRYDKLRLT